jgi:hypothetical protein
MKLKNQKLINIMVVFTTLFFYNIAEGQLASNSRSVQHKHVSTTPFTYSEVSFDGEITVTDNDRDIKSISNGGYLKISKSSFGISRKLVLRGKEGGLIERTYFEGRNEVAYEPDGREWLADILLDVVRQAGIDAQGRINRIYSNDGVNGVLNEIDRIDGNAGKSNYFDALMKKKLKDQEYVSVAYSISKTMSSNAERGVLYRKHTDTFLKNDMVAASYFQGIRRLSSDAERGSILRHVLKNELTAGQMKEVLRAIEATISNAEKGSILRKINISDIENMGLSNDYFDVINSMSSNAEKGSVFRSIMTEVTLSDKMMVEMFYSVEKMTSNAEMESVIREAIDKYKLSDKATIALLHTIETLSSNSEKGSCLRLLAPKLSKSNPSVMRTFKEVSNTLSSDAEYRRVMDALTE